MIIPGKCICGIKGKFICPALEASICSQCCGLKRNSKIICTAECPNNPFGFTGYDKGLEVSNSLSKKTILFLRDEIGEFKFKNIIDSELEGINDENADEAFAEEATRISLLFQKMMFQVKNSDGLTRYQVWEKNGFKGLSNDEKQNLVFKKDSSPAIVEVQRKIDDLRVECIDLLGSKSRKILICDKSLVARCVKFQIFSFWITPQPHYFTVLCNAFDVKREFLDQLMGHLKLFAENYNRDCSGHGIRDYLKENYFKVREILTRLAKEHREKVIEGLQSQVEFITSKYDIKGSFEDVTTILRSKPDFVELDEEERRDSAMFSFDWLRKGESKKIERKMLSFFQHSDDSESAGILGSLDIYDNHIIFKASSRQKYKFAEKMLKKYLDDKIAFCSVESQSLKETLDKRKEDFVEDESEEQEKDSIPPEVKKEVLNKFLVEHYRKLLEEKIPILNDLTPRQVAKIPEMRQKLLDFAKLHIESLEKQGLSEIAENLIAELDLKELKS